MKSFFTKKRIAYLAITCATLLTLIVLLIVPIGSTSNKCYVYVPAAKWFGTLTTSVYPTIGGGLTTPFTYGNNDILVAQTIVFTIVGVVFVVFLTLFTIELAKAGAFKRRPRRPSRVQQLEQQIEELQKQVDELKDTE